MKRLIIGACLILLSLTGFAQPNPNLTFVIPAKTYGDAPFDLTTYTTRDGSGTLTYTKTGGTLGIVTLSGAGNKDVTINGAGSVEITVTLAPDPPYSGDTKVYTLVVSPASLTITANDVNKTYGATLSGGSGSTAFSSSSLQFGETIGTVTIAYGTGSAANAAVGTYTNSVVASAATGGTFTASNYSITYNAGNIIIGTLPITVTATAGQTKVYGASNPVYAYSVAPALIGGDSFTGALSRAAGENVGTYALSQGTLSAGANYTITFVSNNFSITVKPITVTATAGQTKVYGASDPVFAYSVSPALIGGDSFTGALSRVAGENVGTYALTQGTLSAGTNYTISFVSNNFSITVKSILITADAGQTKVYGLADPAPFTYTYAPALIGGDSFTGALSRAAGENVGTYLFTLGTLSAGSNYSLSVAATPTFSITVKPITVTATAGQTKVYGASNPVYAYTNAPALIGGDSFTGALSRAAGENVGNYAITQGTLSAGTNYTITFVSNNFSITVKPITVTATAGQTKVYGASNPVYAYSVAPALIGGDSFTGALSRAAGENVGTYALSQGTLSAGANYTITFVSNNFSITVKPITVTATAGQTKVYGASDPVFAYSVSPALIGGDSFTGALSRVAGENVGTYALTQGTLSAGTNYTISFVSNNFSITVKSILITADAGQTKVYGLADPAPFTYTYAPALIGGDSFTGALSRAAGENVGTYLFTLGTLSAGSNYSLSVAATPTFSITVKPITVTATAGQTKVYGASNPVYTYTYAPALIGGDSFTGALSRVAGENVGTYSITQGTLSPGTNYTITFVSDNFSITVKPITVTATAGQTKVYGASNPVYAYSVAPALIGGDSFTGALSRAAGENIGAYAITQGTLSAGTNYTITFVSNNFAITAKPITVTATSGQSKVYNNGADPVFAYTVSPSLIGGDSFTGALSRIAGENIGTYALTQGTLSAGTNYTITFVSNNFTILAKTLTVTGITADNKIYNRTTTATLTTSGYILNGIVGLEIVTLDAVSYTANFDTKNVGTGKPVTVSGLLLSGANAGNYTLTQPAGLTANITKANLTVFGSTANNKVYDGTTIASLSGTPSVTPISGDIVTAGGTAIASFADKNIGAGKTVTIAGVTISGTDAANYNLIQQTGLTANITIKTITIGGTFTANNKYYDGTTAATIATNSLALITVISGDAVTLNAVANFVDKNVGTGKTVELISSTITGADAANYFLNTTGSPTTTAEIIRHDPVTIAGSFTVVSTKVYDATTSSSISSNSLSLVGVKSGDVVTLVAGAAYIDKNVTTGKVVNLSNSTLTGTDAANYYIDFTGSPTTTANITPRPLTVSATGANKIYDGTNSGSATYTDNRMAGDVLSASGTAVFSDKNVGTGKVVSVTAITLTGTDAGNYTCNTTASTTANITPRPLSVTATAIPKVYDGTTSATVTLSDNRITGDVLLTAYTTAIFSDKNVGIGKTINVSGISISGTDAANYTNNTTIGTTGPINPRLLTVTATGINKVYDATTSATVTLGDNRIAGDVLVTAYASANFIDKNVGTGKSISVSGISKSGTDAANYTNNTTTSTTGNITARSLTVSATGIDKQYDGTTSANVILGDNRISGDILTATFVSASFFDKNAGSTLAVSVTGITISGTDAGNYSCNTTASTTANILQKPLTVAISALDKVYDCNSTASLNTATATLSGILGTEAVTLNSTGYSANFVTANSGNGIAITVTGLSLSGADAGNYTLTQPAGLTANITKKQLTATVNNISKTYGDINPTFTVTYTGFAPCDNVSAIATLVTVTTSATQYSNVNTYTLIPSAGLANNYSFLYVNGTLTINKATITVTPDPKNKIYGDVNPGLTCIYTGFKGTDTQVVLDVQPTLTTTASTISDVGTYPITATGGTDNNYTYSYLSGTLTITKANLRISIHNMSKFQGDAMPANIVAYIYNKSDLKFPNDSAKLDFPFGLTATCNASSAVGNYVIDFPATPVDNNYNITDFQFNTPYKKGVFHVVQKISISTQPESKSGCMFSNVQFPVTATGVNLKYLWLVKKRASDTFHPIVDSDSLKHKGDSTATFIITSIDTLNNGYKFYSTITSQILEDSITITKPPLTDTKTTNTVDLAVAKSPPNSPILLKGTNMLICTNDTAYTWLWGKGENAISGETRQYYTPSDVSNLTQYWVQTTNKSGCTTKVYYDAGNKPFDWHAFGLRVAPTPNNGTFTVTSTGLAANTAVTVEIWDLKATRYSYSGITKTTGTELVILSTEINGGKKLPPGIYFIVVTQNTAKKRGVGKIIVNSN